MLAVVLGITTALVYGFADFFGAVASRRHRPVLVAGLAGWVGLAGLLLCTATGLFHATYSLASIQYGLLGGVFSAFGLACLYQALAIGPISILSPLAAVTGAVVPAAFGAIVLGERFGSTSWIAIALVMVAIVLVAYHPEGHSAPRPTTRGLLYGLGAGAGIGGVLVVLHLAPATDGVAAITLMRLVNASLLGAVLLAQTLRRRSGMRDFADISVRMWLTIFATGILDAAANLLFVYASGLGSLTVVSVLTSLYPLGTILLARIVLKERLAINQGVGIALALGASVLLAF